MVLRAIVIIVIVLFAQGCLLGPPEGTSFADTVGAPPDSGQSMPSSGSLHNRVRSCSDEYGAVHL